MSDSNITQSNNTVTNGSIVSGNQTINNFKKTKLSSLFDKLNETYNEQKQIDVICDDLKRFMDGRDTIGLEQKLINGNRQHLFENAMWLKEEYSKKLTKYQFYEHAQEIHAFILGVVLEKFTHKINPIISAEQDDIVVMKAISDDIISPLITMIQEEGCSDIMGLGATDINGMVYFLTGRCHIKWEK